MPSGNNGGLPLDLEPLIEHQRSVSTRSFGKPGLARLRHRLVPLALGTAALSAVICTLHEVPSWSQRKPGAPWWQGALFATATNSDANFPGVCLDEQPLNDFSSATAMSKAGWKLNWTAPSAFKPAKALYGVGVSNGSYWGYRSLGAGAINLELRGNGNLTLDFGNSWIAFGSSVIAYLDGKEIARAHARNLSVVVTVPFQNRSMVQIFQQMNSVIVVNYVKIMCENLDVDTKSTSLVDAKAGSTSNPPLSTAAPSAARGQLVESTTISNMLGNRPTAAQTSGAQLDPNASTTSQNNDQTTFNTSILNSRMTGRPHTTQYNAEAQQPSPMLLPKNAPPKLNTGFSTTMQQLSDSPAMLLNPAVPADDCGDPCRPPGMADAVSVSGDTTTSTTQTSDLSRTLPVPSTHLNKTVVAELNATSSLTDNELQSGTIEVVTVETRNGNTAYPVPGVQGAYFHNLGASEQWHGFITKVQLYHAFVKQQAAVSSSKLLILADGSDLVFGGCSSEELLARYQQTVAASGGAEVICGADSAIWPKHTKWHSEGPEVNDTWRYDSFQGRMNDMLTAVGLGGKPNPYSTYMWRGPPQYVNSGFIMGPASALLEILDCMLKRGGGTGLDFDDQLALTECMFHRPDSVAIDYGGSLVLTLQGFHRNVAMGHGGIFLNKVIAKSQCFLHFNAFEDKNIKEWLQTWTAEVEKEFAVPSSGANAIDDKYHYDDRVGHWGGTCTCPGSGRVYEVGDNNNKCLSLACDGGHASPCRAMPADWKGTGMHVTCG